MAQSVQSVQRVIQHGAVAVPTFIYGTAWKEENTQVLVETALAAGFRGIDTANQRRHYDEAAVGNALNAVVEQRGLTREDLFVQTKFTDVAAQDHRLPYDPHADYADQVVQSLQSSLDHLRTSYVDAYILHGPSTLRGLTAADWEIWRAMEQLQNQGVARSIGISNITSEQLTALLEEAAIKPSFVQNRCFARTRWDAATRALCRDNDICYQGFSLLTANAAELNRPQVHAIARRLGCTLAQVVFRFCLQAGMIVLTGTTRQQHMREDLGVYGIEELTLQEMDVIENVARL
jgi:diketogulonate reductase-like aldo/keto reductase